MLSLLKHTKQSKSIVTDLWLQLLNIFITLCFISNNLQIISSIKCLVYNILENCEMPKLLESKETW